MSTLREFGSPRVPSRSPFRIRDSQLKKETTHDRWSFTVELGNMWNIKPQHKLCSSIDNAKNLHHHHSDTALSSSHLLTQLLVSQAILDSNDYKVLTFDNLDQLKKELLHIQDHLANVSKNIQLENKIANISKSLENVNLKNSRNSVIYLQHQRQNNEHTMKYMSNQLETLKKREIEIKNIILRHTAGTLNKGIHIIENQMLHQKDGNNNVLNQVIRRINQLYSTKIPSSSQAPIDTLHKLTQLEKMLLSGKSSKKDLLKANQNKMQLLAIQLQKDQLVSKMIDMELLTTKLLSHISILPRRQMAFKMELMQYRSEALEIRLWEKKRQRNEDADALSLAMSNHQSGGNNQLSVNTIKQRYQKQLDDQASVFEADLSKQNTLLQHSNQKHQHLESACAELASEKSDLDRLVQEKSRQIDQQDNEMSRLNHELRNLRNPPPIIPKDRSSVDNQFIQGEKMRLKKDFEQRESRWISHTTAMEDSFDQLLDNFDRLTNSAMEFDSHRMRYDKKIDSLHQTINVLEMQLYDEKVKRIGYETGHNHAPTTVLLRKEFRLLVADIKKAHELRMDREAEEIRRLQLQLQELRNTNTKSYKYQHSMATQT